MSHRWNSRVQLQIGARHLRATLQPITITAALAQPLPQAIAALLAELAQQTPLQRARLQVTLDDAHVHLDVVAGDYASYSDAQLQAIAQGCVAELLGEAAAGQAVRWQLQPDLHHLLLCAMDQQLVDGVLQAAAQHGLRLASLQPAFCRHWNRHASALPRGTGVFCVQDGGHSLVACALRGSITALSYGAGTASAPVPAATESDTGVVAPPTSQALDARVDRLLASLGQQAQALADFVLLARQPLDWQPSARWRVCDAPQELA